jgi:hypothetical protein
VPAAPFPSTPPQAIDAWLKGDGLTVKDLESRKAMVQRVVGYLVGWVGRELSGADGLGRWE